MKLTVHTTDELLAAVPHLIGFHVANSIVVIAASDDLPCARVDIPSSQAEMTGVIDSLMAAYGHTGHGVVLLIGFADTSAAVDSPSEQMRQALTRAGVQVAARIWADDVRWFDLDSGQSGMRDTRVASLMDVEMVAAGRVLPVTSRKAVAESFVGDPEPVARCVSSALELVAASTPDRERRWAVGCSEVFAVDGQALSDASTARLLICLQSLSIRDQLAAGITCESAPRLAALWEDTTRRSPEDLVAPSASLAALANWCRGDGARAWSALDRISPQEQESYPLAKLVAAALRTGLHPREWERAQSTTAQRPSKTDMKDVPSTLGTRHRPDPPPSSPPRSSPPRR